VSSATVINSMMSSSLAAGATHPLSNYFHMTDQEQLVLPTSIFLAGHTFGPLLFGPLSESFGRKWTMIYAFMLFLCSNRQRPRTKLACSDCIPIICQYIWSLSYSSGWRVCIIVPKFYTSELTLIGYVQTYATIPKAADELWHYSWPLLLLALYWVQEFQASYLL